VPTTVNVNAGLPATTEVGLIPVIVGVDVLAEIVNVAAFVVDCPSTTLTETVPDLASAKAGMHAVSCVDETNVVDAARSPKWTIDVLSNPVPATASFKVLLPAFAVVGEMPLRAGAVDVFPRMPNFTEDE